jgi:hypothetical protein
LLIAKFPFVDSVGVAPVDAPPVVSLARRLALWFAQQKSRSLKRARCAFPRTAALLVGPSLDLWRREQATPIDLI